MTTSRWRSFESRADLPGLFVYSARVTGYQRRIEGLPVTPACPTTARAGGAA
jgi:hypothetical protein